MLSSMFITPATHEQPSKSVALSVRGGSLRNGKTKEGVSFGCALKGGLGLGFRAELQGGVYVYIYIHTYIHYIYIYVCIHTSTLPISSQELRGACASPPESLRDVEPSAEGNFQC